MRPRVIMLLENVEEFKAWEGSSGPAMVARQIALTLIRKGAHLTVSLMPCGGMAIRQIGGNCGPVIMVLNDSKTFLSDCPV